MTMNDKDEMEYEDGFTLILKEYDIISPNEMINLWKKYGKNSSLTNELPVGKYKLIWLSDEKWLSNNNLFIDNLWKISDTNPHDTCCVSCIVEDANSFSYLTFNGIWYYMKILDDKVVLDHTRIVK